MRLNDGSTPCFMLGRDDANARSASSSEPRHGRPGSPERKTWNEQRRDSGRAIADRPPIHADLLRWRCRCGQLNHSILSERDPNCSGCGALIPFAAQEW